MAFLFVSLCTPVNDYSITELVDNLFNNWFITINPIHRFSPDSILRSDQLKDQGRVM